MPNQCEENPATNTIKRAGNSALFTYLAFVAYDLTNVVMDKEWPSSNEALFSFNNLITFACANLAGATAFNIKSLWDVMSASKEAIHQKTIKLALPAIVNFLYEASTSFISFFPFSMGIELATVSMPVEQDSYDELAELACKTIGSLATTTVLGHLKPYLQKQELILLFIALTIMTYNDDISELYDKFADAQWMQTALTAFLTPLIAVAPSVLAPATNITGRNIYQFFQEKYNNILNTDNAEDKNEHTLRII